MPHPKAMCSGFGLWEPSAFRCVHCGAPMVTNHSNVLCVNAACALYFRATVPKGCVHDGGTASQGNRRSGACVHGGAVGGDRARGVGEEGRHAAGEAGGRP